MLENILKKLGVKSIEEFVEREREFLRKFDGMEAERKNPASVLTDEELDFMMEYTKDIVITL